MDWLKDMLGEGGKGEGGDDLMAAFRQGEDAAKEYVSGLVDKGNVLIDDGKAMEATVMLFTAVWRSVGLAKLAVDKSVERLGDASPVKKMWDILGPVLSAGTEAEGLAALRKIKDE